VTALAAQQTDYRETNCHDFFVGELSYTIARRTE
jgi:hypothetical protein